MFKPLALFTLACLGALGGYLAYFQLAKPEPITHGGQPELEWLRREFRVSDAQFAEVQRLHEEYAPKCAELCAKVSASQRQLRETMSREQVPPAELQEAIAQCAQVEAECKTSMLAHVHAVGQHMSPEARERLIKHMLQRLVHPTNIEEVSAPSYVHEHAAPTHGHGQGKTDEPK